MIKEDYAVELVKEIWAFLRVRKRFWLAPIIFVLFLLGLLMLAAGAVGPFAPFFYPF